MLRHFKSPTLRAGLIALILLASVPEVRCCCDVSWGPAGLFGNRARCVAHTSSQPVCDCCHRERQDESPPADGFGSQDCPCRFTVVNPSAMAAGPSADSAQAPILEAWNQASTASSFVGANLAARDFVERPCSALTPVKRCALFQTWLV